MTSCIMMEKREPFSTADFARASRRAGRPVRDLGSAWHVRTYYPNNSQSDTGVIFHNKWRAIFHAIWRMGLPNRAVISCI